MSASRWFEGQLKQIALLVGVSTVLLTASFVGLLALLTSEAAGVADRFPLYVLVMAVAFVITIISLVRHDADGRTVLSAATGVSVLALVLGLLAGEGVVYAWKKPSEVFGSQLLFYFLAAGLIATGLSYWTVNYWRDVIHGGTMADSAARGTEE